VIGERYSGPHGMAVDHPFVLAQSQSVLPQRELSREGPNGNLIRLPDDPVSEIESVRGRALSSVLDPDCVDWQLIVSQLEFVVSPLATTLSSRPRG
jgi:hypothetical protein